MVKQAKYEIVFAPETAEHLAHVDAKHYPLIEQKIGEQLSHQPLRQTRNRKPLRPPAPFGADWELRFGPQNSIRVLYEVDELTRTVNILAIGIKDGNRLLIAGQEIKS
ncbi:MAG: hypothetical protein SFU86_05370 [Pirellulaceae bacterium]|nr:hypothetical protein [Pirellulaceae bacterium]